MVEGSPASAVPASRTRAAGETDACASRGVDAAELLRRSGRGDEPAFAQLYDATSLRLFDLVLRVVRDRVMAERVTQEVYLDVWRQSARYDPARGSASAWLMTTAYRAALAQAGAALPG